MSTKVLEKTITDLQRRVAEIESKMNGVNGGWKKIAGAANLIYS